MPVSYVYQDSIVTERIAPELIQNLSAADPIFNYFPIEDINASKVRWTVDDNYRGLMNLRGYDGAPTRVLRPSKNMYEAEPGVYGEQYELSEQELTTRAAGFPATLNVPMNISDMVSEGQMVLATRQVQRRRQITWTLAVTHNLLVPLPQGGIGHQESFAGQTLTVGTLWSNLQNATPLHDLRQLQFLYGWGTSNDFCSPAEAWMNSQTAQYILDNRNANDLGGIRAEYGQTVFNSIEGTNSILLSQGAPKIKIFNDSYQMDTPTGGTYKNNQYQLYLPTGVVWIVAQRPGNEKPGVFLNTRHVVNGGGTQPYAFVVDQTKATPHPMVPPKVIVHQGFNGGPAQRRPSQTVTMIVA